VANLTEEWKALVQRRKMLRTTSRREAMRLKKIDRHLDFLEMVAQSEQFAWYHQLQEQFFREVS
jgi:hypothetical protein